MTLDGTRTYLIGRERIAVIDPGSDDPGHLLAISGAIVGTATGVLLTHAHPDHAAGAETLASALGCSVRAFAHGNLSDGDELETDAGALIALATPGHTADHAAFHLPTEDAVFCGDLMMGGLDTALVAPPEGDLTEYLDSLTRLRALKPRIIYPAHGAPFADPEGAITRYIRHRSEREAQVLHALAVGPLDLEALVDAVYGPTLQPALRGAALGAVRAYLRHLSSSGRVHTLPDARWARSDTL
jgi:glyoxylase-like metal-dependent hydrolase (beta-lactamase superfamily II)